MEKQKHKWKMWLTWAAASLLLGGYLGYRMVGNDKEIYLIGETSDGHYQIELACSACHKESFGGTASLQQACMDCHGEELQVSDDSHPKSKFTDPRNADRVRALDARMCITCHREHKPEITQAMAVTLPMDFCIRCHDDVGKERATHKDLAFDTCASAGCHNFHDNRSLYEDFLVKHANEPVNLPRKVVPQRNLVQWIAKTGSGKSGALRLHQHDGPADKSYENELLQDWLNSAHAQNAVNCGDCHERDSKGQKIAWVDQPGTASCSGCHQLENNGFESGKHGMRIARGLSPMKPGMARQDMNADIANHELDCVSCHGPHKSDTRKAAVESCIGCHNDDHTLAYQKSSHFRLWQESLRGTRPAEQGVSCATCHMARIETKQKGATRILVQHNQNDNLRPNEKMIRSVCMNCHGLGFSIDALADPELVRNNFSGKPGVHIESIDWAASRVGKEKKTR